LSGATLTFHVTGDSYWELREKADAVIVEFLREDDEVDSDYVAEVTARVKPRR